MPKKYSPFERTFQWTMKYGSRILFTLAALLFAFGTVQSIFGFLEEVHQFATVPTPDYASMLAGVPGTIYMIVSVGGRAFGASVMPLFAALLINHLDHWARSREKP